MLGITDGHCSSMFGSLLIATFNTFDSIPSLSSSHLNATINDHIRNGRLLDAWKLFDENPQCRNVCSWNSMMNGYIRHDRIRCARRLFDEMPERDVVSWNTMLAGFRRAGDSEQAIQHFLQMERVGLRSTEFTLSTVISVASEAGCVILVPQLHARAIRLAFESNAFVGTALIGGYANLDDCIALHQVFDEVSLKTVALWNSLISGYMDLGFVGEARAAFETMPERNIVSWTSLVNGYVCNRMLDEASCCFNRMPERNVISWTVMISGYEQNGRFFESLELFLSMRESGIQPNQSTLSAVLSSCAGCSSLLIGRQIHVCILKSGLPVDVVLSSSLVDMYAKCGDVDAAVHIFESMENKNLVSWNSIIGGYARHGLSARALEQFKRMTEDGPRPDHITFVSVLSACGHGGLVVEGERYFASMEGEYGIKAGMEHYTCMVDLYGRAGHLDKAVKFIETMPFEPDVVIWGSLLGACGVHSSLEIGSHAAKSIHSLEQDHPAIYMLLSKIHGDRGAWDKVIELREMMKKMGAKKQKGSSWVESSFGYISDDQAPYILTCLVSAPPLLGLAASWCTSSRWVRASDTNQDSGEEPDVLWRDVISGKYGALDRGWFQVLEMVRGAQWCGGKLAMWADDMMITIGYCRILLGRNLERQTTVFAVGKGESVVFGGMPG
ncbi:pentatricopeptide repeat-containing protein At4g02750-like [Magnolia sinica]|uniref:pentatricopeptide repeat-containing protein At4g02750-like n=1 Tax=Magnolia sinica TaxID=86752 RepID=UPI0026592EB7|nr:pentatricopeptide repeat-containing protein At4g02750-like [Magnolia sinica]